MNFVCFSNMCSCCLRFVSSGTVCVNARSDFFQSITRAEPHHQMHTAAIKWFKAWHQCPDWNTNNTSVNWQYNGKSAVFVFPGPQPASVMELPAQEGPSTSRDPVPVSYQLKVSFKLFLLNDLSDFIVRFDISVCIYSNDNFILYVYSILNTLDLHKPKG